MILLLITQLKLSIECDDLVFKLIIIQNVSLVKFMYKCLFCTIDFLNNMYNIVFMENVINKEYAYNGCEKPG